jgi:DNA topoisomerase-2
MILANGCIVGIGTGWSCNVPCYNPTDLVDCIKIWLEHDGVVTTEDGSSLLPDLKPWYRGHKGEMTFDGKRFVSWGIAERDEDKGKMRITELPVGYWTSDFTEKLEQMKAEKQIANYKNHSTPKTVDFTIMESKETDELPGDSELGLYSYIHTSNMVMFSEENNLKKYSSVHEIIDNYCRVRYSFYTKRKEYKLRALEKLIKNLGNKKRFLEEVRDGELKLFSVVKGKRMSRKTTEIVAELEERGYDKENSTDEEDKTGDSEEEDEEKRQSAKRTGHGYEYLLRMQISSITAEKIEKLKNDIASKILDRDTLLGTTEKEMWKSDLETFLEAYNPYVESLDGEKGVKKVGKGTVAKKAVARKAVAKK